MGEYMGILHKWCICGHKGILLYNRPNPIYGQLGKSV